MENVIWPHKENFKTLQNQGLIRKIYFQLDDTSQRRFFMQTISWKSHFKIWGRLMAF